MRTEPEKWLPTISRPAHQPLGHVSPETIVANSSTPNNVTFVFRGS
jgi:hypothetical protein